MRIDPRCDIAIMKAAAEDPTVDGAVKRTMAAEARIADDLTEALYEGMLEEAIPAPSQFPEEYWESLLRNMDEQQRPIFDDVGTPPPGGAGRPPGGGTPPPGGAVAAGERPTGWQAAKAAATIPVEASKVVWAAFSQMRVALMLSNILTQIKNAATTGAMAGIRFGEEATAISISRLSRDPAARRSYEELWKYGSGMLRATSDFPSVFKALAGNVMRSGTINANKARQALQNAGYAPELARTKADQVVNSRIPEVTLERFSDLFTMKGPAYLFNVAFGSQFALLQGVDTAFKMMAYRAKVQQMLALEAVRKGLHGAQLDTYVSTNWTRMKDEIRTGAEQSELFQGIRSRGVKQAAEDTFTEEAQTGFGSVMMGKFGGPPNFAKSAFSETMQILAPFRAIYVNLMRQTFSRRLLPIIDKQTRMEWSGALGAERQQLAMARTAAAYTLVVGTAVALDQAGIKVHGPGSGSAEAQRMQYELTGKVGNTLQIGDFYVPLDTLPPSIGIPLGYIAAYKQGQAELQYRYHAPEDQEEYAMRALAPLMRAVTDGPWVKEYMLFLSRAGAFFQSGNIEGFSAYLADVAVGPMKTPNWLAEMRGADRTESRQVENWQESIMSNLLDYPEAYSLRRNMFGRPIQKLERFGPQSDKPWYKSDDDVATLLNAAEYDMVLTQSNPSTSISGDGNGYNGVKSTVDSVQMDRKALEQFEIYAGQSRLNSRRMTFQEELREVMHAPGIWNFETNTPRITPTQLQTLVSELHQQRRSVARELIKYNPKFGIREKQIERFYDEQLRSGIDPQKAEQLRQLKYDDLRRKRLALAEYF